MGYVRSCRAVLPHMVERGSGAIVLVVGNDGLKPSYWEMTAGAANAADLNFASSLAEQYGPKGIRVNTVNPGPVDTGYATPEGHEIVRRRFPLGRWGTPDDPARLIAWLATDEAAWITGQVINTEGGFRRSG
jgi:3-oxoacyl-[acyl-carrier protein] reductase